MGNRQSSIYFYKSVFFSVKNFYREKSRVVLPIIYHLASLLFGGNGKMLVTSWLNVTGNFVESLKTALYVFLAGFFLGSPAVLYYNAANAAGGSAGRQSRLNSPRRLLLPRICTALLRGILPQEPRPREPTGPGCATDATRNEELKVG